MSRSSENLPQHDEFLAGYLAGMDAGSALVGAGPPDEAILEPAAWPPPCYRALPLTYPQSFDPTASPDSTHLLSLDEIIDVKLFRLGTTLDPLAILQQWMQSKQAAESTLLLEDESPTPEPPRKVQLTHDVCTTTFEVTIARYQPGPGDTTGYSWTDEAGCKRTYELPPYYISDLGEAARNLRHYIWEAKAEFTRALLVGSNPVVLKTFKEAERYHVDSNSELVADALMLWSATRMIERFWLITGDDMLGLPPMKQSIGPCRFNPYIDAAVPVTPIMDTQLDEIAIKDVLVPLKARLLTLLKKKVLEKKKENWYEIFLAIFIILHNSEIVLGQVMDYSRRYGISFASRSNDESSLSHAYYHACKTVLAYFHFASGGAAPLSLDWVAHNTDTSIMSQSQIAFLCDLKEELERQNDKLQGLKTQSMYDTEMFWCHQMLFANWKADMPYSGKFLACTEKDFLLS
ncbi:hypothetical protein QQX98_006273 [Neonectria punicea]|uniref:Uncharacterized protein n=1 Tax=Neonectria punicea TaxID=979145 RepID=A0ABR1H1Y0_9HYPO